MAEINFQELEEGTVINLGPYLVSKEELLEFAEEFDPAPFHLDEEAASKSILGGLATSGWHNCAILMRMMCDAYIMQSGSLGSPGIEYCKWGKPVLAGDMLSGTSKVLSVRKSNSLQGVGIVEFEHKLQNQHGETVMELANVGFFKLQAS